MDKYISKKLMLKNLTSDLEHHVEEVEPLTVLIMQRFIKYVEDFPAVDLQPRGMKMTDVICDYDFCKHYENGKCGLDTVEICGGYCEDIDDKQEDGE